MFELFIFVLILVLLTLALKPPGRFRGTRRAFFSGASDNPFQGRMRHPPPKSGDHSIDKGALTRCHNCSCFFPMGQVVHEIVEGHLLEFCSQNCRNHFLQPNRG